MQKKIFLLFIQTFICLYYSHVFAQSNSTFSKNTNLLIINNKDSIHNVSIIEDALPFYTTIIKQSSEKTLYLGVEDDSEIKLVNIVHDAIPYNEYRQTKKQLENGDYINDNIGESFETKEIILEPVVVKPINH